LNLLMRASMGSVGRELSAAQAPAPALAADGCAAAGAEDADAAGDSAAMDVAVAGGGRAACSSGSTDGAPCCLPPLLLPLPSLPSWRMVSFATLSSSVPRPLKPSFAALAYCCMALLLVALCACRGARCDVLLRSARVLV
jgi:hypothetical protein